MTDEASDVPAPITRALADLVYEAFNSRVMALDRYNGELVWTWVSPEGTSAHVALLLDGDRLIASVQGYTYCIDPLTGEQVWANRLTGLGVGIPSLASINGNTGQSGGAAVVQQQQAAAAANAGS